MAKRTDQRVAEAKRLKAEGRPLREIAEILTKQGVKVTHNTVKNWLEEADSPAPSVAPPSEGTPAPPPVAPREPIVLSPLDSTPMQPDALTGLLSGFVRRLTEEAEKLLAEGDQAGYQRISRTVAQLAGTVQRHQAGKDDSDTMRVSLAEMNAAAERARSKLHDLVARLSAERSR